MSKNSKPNLWVRYTSKSPVFVTVFSVVLGLVVGALVIIATSPVILKAWSEVFGSWSGIFHALKVTLDNVGAAYRSIFTGSIVDPPQFWHALTTGKDWTLALTPISETLTYTAPLLIASIGVGIAFQAGMFNIGANGQAVMGGIVGTAAGSMLHLPTVAHVPLTLLAGILGGVIAGIIPGLLKAFTGAHEVIITLMLNYVIAFFLIYTLLSTAIQQPGQQNDVSRYIDPTAQLSPLFGVHSGLRVNWGILIAGIVVVFAWWFLERSTLGFDFRVTGANPKTAQASGISAKVVIVLVFLISGGLAGLAGAVQVSSTTHFLDGGFLVGSAGIGFTAITVSLLGRNKPIGIIWGSLLFGALNVGGRVMQASTTIPLDLATIIQSVIVLFVATPVLVKEIFRLRVEHAEAVQLSVKGWS